MGADPKYDFRVVIDVSSSMQQTDPQNLRVSALKLLSGLIPAGSRAGVWTFGKYVNMVVKWGRVSDSWRKQADLGADRIHANAQLTNIEGALRRASVGWDKPDPDTRRILLLLTDGKVEVSKDPAKNAVSRAAVLEVSLPALKRAGVEVHGIALSQASDQTLLRRLALETGGSFIAASDAGRLQKLFFRMFERATQPDTVALNGKEFAIDASIKEMTLLVFRGAGGSPTLLIPPDSPAISAQKPRASRWRSDRGYDLIKVKNPEPGSWRIDAEIDPDNRLMVVTDLELKVDGLPAYATPRTAFEIAVELHNRGNKIRKNSFLRFVDFKVTHVDAEGNRNEYTMTHTSKREDKGRYLYPVTQNLAEGLHRFVVSADTRSFSRSKRFELQVRSPVEVVIEPQSEPGVYDLKLRARSEYLKPDGLVAEASLEAPDGSRDPVAFELDHGWMRARIATDQDGLYRAQVRVSAQNHATEIHDIDLGSFSMLGVYRAPVTPAAEAVEAQDASADAAPPESIDWRLVGVVVVVVNLLLMLLIAVGWLIYRRRKALPDAALLEEDEMGA